MDCVAGTMRCLFNTRLTCTGSGWVGTQCAQGQACKDDQCVPAVCVPREGICIANPNVPDAQIGLICSLNGTAWASQNPCGSGEVCKEGYCFPKTVPPPPPADSGPPEVATDAGRPDEGPSEVPPTPADPGPLDPGPTSDEIPFVEPNWAVINGNLVTFTAFVRANYTGASETTPALLQVTLHSAKMDGVPFPDVLEKQQMIEIHFPGIAAGATGEFRCEDDQVQVWYRFGKYLPGGECKDYDYHGVSCVVNLDGFEMDAGGEVLRASGTFDPVYLEDCLPGGPPVTITDGHFLYER